jgi:hypothetical protein
MDTCDIALEIDLIKMSHFDQFLADNFVRCFFRYYSKLPQYAKEVYLEALLESETLRIKESCPNQARA